MMKQTRGVTDVIKSIGSRKPPIIANNISKTIKECMIYFSLFF